VKTKTRLATYTLAVSAGCAAAFMTTAPVNAAEIGRLYEHAERAGASTVVTAGSSTFECDHDLNGRDTGIANVGAAWNDRISSFDSWLNCRFKLYADANYRGTSTAYLRGSQNVGRDLNDRTTSFEAS
jgi:hypothetical protein